MSLQEYRERQRLAYLQRKREEGGEDGNPIISNSTNEQSNQDCSAQHLGSETVPTALRTEDGPFARDAATSSSSGINRQNPYATPPPSDDTCNDALLAQILSAEMEASNDVDEASAAAIAELIAGDAEDQSEALRIPDAVFQERLISEFHSPVSSPTPRGQFHLY